MSSRRTEIEQEMKKVSERITFNKDRIASYKTTMPSSFEPVCDIVGIESSLASSLDSKALDLQGQNRYDDENGGAPVSPSGHVKRPSWPEMSTTSSPSSPTLNDADPVLVEREGLRRRQLSNNMDNLMVLQMALENDQKVYNRLATELAAMDA
ncbi:hypothetical protein BGZ58_007548 [Dissophora ornata]|nr:hypothetical protein BGZ58_007548 [Dissophora ornata]